MKLRKITLKNILPHLLLGFWTLVVHFPVYVAMGMPIAVFVLSEFIRQIPHDLTEAATIDGAERFRIYRSILVPLSAVPVMALYLMMSKQFIEGLTAGAVKG